MQVLKDDIKRRILDVARQEFNQRGFTKASMRDIAAKVGIGVGNLYNYYPSKDDLFRAVLAPVVSACYAMFDRHHGEYGHDALSMTRESYLLTAVSDYMTVITGEGRMDMQTLMGKTPYGIMKRAQRAGIPTAGICGKVEAEAIDRLQAAGFRANISRAAGIIALG